MVGKTYKAFALLSITFFSLILVSCNSAEKSKNHPLAENDIKTINSICTTIQNKLLKHDKNLSIDELSYDETVKNNTKKEVSIYIHGKTKAYGVDYLDYTEIFQIRNQNGKWGLVSYNGYIYSFTGNEYPPEFHVEVKKSIVHHDGLVW